MGRHHDESPGDARRGARRGRVSEVRSRAADVNCKLCSSSRHGSIACVSFQIGLGATQHRSTRPTGGACSGGFKLRRLGVHRRTRRDVASLGHPARGELKPSPRQVGCRQYESSNGTTHLCKRVEAVNAALKTSPDARNSSDAAWTPRWVSPSAHESNLFRIEAVVSFAECGEVPDDAKEFAADRVAHNSAPDEGESAVRIAARVVPAPNALGCLTPLREHPSAMLGSYR